MTKRELTKIGWCPLCSRNVSRWKRFPVVLFIFSLFTMVGWVIVLIGYACLYPERCPMCRHKPLQKAHVEANIA